jgi:hypothetical protein
MKPATLVALAILLAPLSAAAGDTPAPTEPWDLTNASVYSNMCVDPETGDALGMRVFLRPRGSEPRIVVQYAEGVPTKARATHSEVDGYRVRFTIGDTLAETYSGAIRGQTMVLHVKRMGRLPLRLRLRDDIHGFPDCAGDGGRY